MTFLAINLTDWAALFYIGKWLFFGIVIGAIIMVVREARRKKREEGE